MGRRCSPFRVVISVGLTTLFLFLMTEVVVNWEDISSGNQDISSGNVPTDVHHQLNDMSLKNAEMSISGARVERENAMHENVADEKLKKQLTETKEVIDQSGNYSNNYNHSKHIFNRTDDVREVIPIHDEDINIERVEIHSFTPDNFQDIAKISQKIPKSKQVFRTAEPTLRKTDLLNIKFSPEALRLRALNNTITSMPTLTEFAIEQNRRKEQLLKVCKDAEDSVVQDQGTGRGPPRKLSPFNSVIVDQANYLSFCPVYKVASTSWLNIMLEISGILTKDKKRKGNSLTKIVSQAYPKISNLAVPSVSRDTIKFIVVRHPFERLLSCYRDKFEFGAKDYYYSRFGEDMMKRFRQLPKHFSKKRALALLAKVSNLLKRGQPVPPQPDNPYSNPVGPTFGEFIQFVIEANFDDEHWRPYNLHCGLCYIEYDIVLKFEYMYQEGKNFIEYLNRSNVTHPRWDNPSIGSSTSEVSCRYYSQLTTDLITKLHEKYRLDFDLFEYSVDKYSTCADVKPQLLF